MPDEIEAAIGLAERDPAVKVIVLRGAGRAFSGGYDFGGGFQHWGDAMNTDGRWDPGKDFAMVSARATGPTQKFMAIWRASKPVIAQVHGWCVGGASDYALCADIVIASDDAVIGTPYARMWGAYLTGMWLYRLGLAKAKWHSLTGEPLTGREAADGRAHQRVGPVRAAGGPRRRGRRRAVPNPVVAVAGSEADRQPGLREHGPGVDPDARRHPGRADAQHPGRAASSSTTPPPRACGPRSSAATGRGATTARPRRSGGPTRHTSSSPRARPAGRAARRDRRPRATCR